MIRVIIADDFPALESVMEELITAAGDMTLTGVATRLEEALELVKTEPHDVMVLDDYLPPLRSPDVIRRMRAEGVESAIVVISMHRDAELARDVLIAGASGFILKPNFMDEFVEGIRRAYAGEKFSSPEIVDALRALLGNTAHELLGV